MTREELLVLIPAHNEAPTVSALAGRVQAMGFPVLVVDDGSTDGTARTLQDMGVEVLRTEQNRGKGAALRLGFRRFAENSSYTAIVMMDADGQHDPEELPRFLEALSKEGQDLVVGTRMHCPGAMPWLRVRTNRLMSWILSKIARQEIPDSQCGYRGLKRSALVRCDFRTDRFEIESEMLLEAARKGLKIFSLPIRSVYSGGSSHIHPLGDTLRFVRFLIRYSFFRRD